MRRKIPGLDMNEIVNYYQPIAKRTRSFKPTICKPLHSVRRFRKNKWISATKLRNYISKDGLVDWLEKYGTSERTFKERNLNDTFQDYIMRKGVEFEEEFINFLRKTHDVVTVSNFYNAEKVKTTIKYMKQGLPIIHSAPVSNKKNNTYGIIDLLIRSDYINNIFEFPPLTQDMENIPAPLLKSKYHYVVLDIKYSTLPLCSDGTHLLNSGRYPAYKSQVLIYNEAIGIIQGYIPPCAYILGRKWKYKKQGDIFSGNSCIDKLGVIDFSAKDSKYVKDTQKALKWVRDVEDNGVKWGINPPTKDKLYPNMCIDSGIWNTTKDQLAKSLGEITLLWQCGVKNREKGFENNIRSWKDPNCTAEKLGVCQSYRNTVDKMIQINRQDGAKFSPQKIENNMGCWKEKKPNEMFVDFESFSDILEKFDLPRQKTYNIIYMIGMGWEEDGKWSYKNFTSLKPTQEEEYRIMNEFATFVESKGFPTLFHWCAEDNFWRRSSNTQFDLRKTERDRNNIIYRWNLENNWLDLCKVFRIEPVIIKGVFGYGLKQIAKKMKEYKMISTKLESECDSGMTAMVKAWKCYSHSSNPVESPIMKDIIKYNEFDCKVLYDILCYLRKEHA